MRFRATCNLIFDFDSDLSHDEAINIARKHLENIKFDNDIENTRVVLQVDKLKNKTERIKLGEFSLDDVFPFVTTESIKKEFCVGDKKYLVKMNSDRYLLFKDNSSCVCCDLKISKVFLECYEADKTPHFNMYGSENNRLILFTKDHIQARAFGGQNTLSNYQTMCALCNSLKAHSNLDIESLRKVRSIYEENKKILTKKKLHFLIEEERKSLEKPWCNQVIKTVAPSNLSFCFPNDTSIVEIEDKLVAVLKENEAGHKVVGNIQKNTYLEPIVEINNSLCFCMSNDKIFYADKKLVCKNT